MSFELRATSVQNFTSPAANLTLRFRGKSFSSVPRLLLAKTSQLHLLDTDDWSTMRNVFFSADSKQHFFFLAFLSFFV
jgi:hypothetical protein